MHEELAQLWDWFADTQCRGYSPLYERVCHEVAGCDDVLALVAAAPPAAHLPTVLLAAVHHLVLSGLDHPLADVYAGTSGVDPGPLFVDVCRSRGDELGELLRTRHTNTNEVGRSALLGPALTEVASRTGRPLGLVDVGCSAGLHLLCDRYRMEYGDHGATGPAGAPVRLSCTVTGGSPPIADRLPRISTRIGLDRDPVDLTDDDAVRWQLACVWPDTGRLERTRAALDEARGAGLRLVRGDAVDGLGALLDDVPDTCTPVVVTTWAFAYLPLDRRAAFTEVLAEASRRRPLAWVSGEAAGVVDLLGEVRVPPDPSGIEPAVLGLVSFADGDHRSEVLAVVHPHGRWLDWWAGPTPEPVP